MVDRWVRIELTNDSGRTIKKIAEHHCRGEWSADWAPPDVVPNGTLIPFQAQNFGGDAAPSAEGWIKFGIPYIDNDGNSAQDELYVYWDNPFIGLPTVKYVVSTQVVQPDCDYNKQPIDLSFPPRPSNFTVFEDLVASGNQTPLGVNLLQGGVPFAGGPVLAAIIFGGNQNEPNIFRIARLAPKPNSIGSFAKAWGFDSRLGLRRLIPDAPAISLRKYFGIA